MLAMIDRSSITSQSQKFQGLCSVNKELLPHTTKIASSKGKKENTSNFSKNCRFTKAFKKMLGTKNPEKRYSQELCKLIIYWFNLFYTLFPLGVQSGFT